MRGLVWISIIIISVWIWYQIIKWAIVLIK